MQSPRYWVQGRDEYEDEDDEEEEDGKEDSEESVGVCVLSCREFTESKRRKYSVVYFSLFLARRLLLLPHCRFLQLVARASSRA